MGILIRLLVVAGLVIDIVVHVHLAPGFAFRPGAITGDWLFRIEALAALLAAALVLIRPGRAAFLVAFLVAGGGVAAVLLYSYVNVGALGPLPDMYDPIWYPEKTVSLVGEAVAALAALVGAVALPRGARRVTSRS